MSTRTALTTFLDHRAIEDKLMGLKNPLFRSPMILPNTLLGILIFSCTFGYLFSTFFFIFLYFLNLASGEFLGMQVLS